MIRSLAKAFQERQKFGQIAIDRWRADSSLLDPSELQELRRRERLAGLWRLAREVVSFPVSAARGLGNIVLLVLDIERLHGAPRRKVRAGRGCVLDRQTWLVNGANIELGNFVKVSAFSALIAGFEATIRVGNYSILGPGVFVVAANHGIAKTALPIRYQPWKEDSVTIGDDVWVGANVVILPGTSIGSGAVIGAGAVVSGEIPAGFIVYQDKGSLVMRQRQ